MIIFPPNRLWPPFYVVLPAVTFPVEFPQAFKRMYQVTSCLPKKTVLYTQACVAWSWLSSVFINDKLLLFVFEKYICFCQTNTMMLIQRFQYIISTSLFADLATVYSRCFKIISSPTPATESDHIEFLRRQLSFCSPVQVVWQSSNSTFFFLLIS